MPTSSLTKLPPGCRGDEQIHLGKGLSISEQSDEGVLNPSVNRPEVSLLTLLMAWGLEHDSGWGRSCFGHVSCLP